MQTRTLASTASFKNFRENCVVQSDTVLTPNIDHRQRKPINIHSSILSKAFNFSFNNKCPQRLSSLHKFQRSFCSASPVSYQCTEQIKQTFMTDRYRELIEAINMDTRMRLSADEFDRLSLEFGFKPEEAGNVRKKLSGLGIILDHSDAHKIVIIKPERVIKSWEESMNLNLSYKSKFILDKKIELESLREELKPYQALADEIDGAAERWADLCMRGLFAYAVGYSAMFTYLIFWLLSWDIMEPASYICGLLNLLFALYFFNAINAEFSFGSLRDAIKTLKKNKLYKKQKFDEMEYNRILRMINEAESDLHNPEWFILNEVSKEMSGVKLPDPIKFSQERDHFIK